MGAPVRTGGASWPRATHCIGTVLPTIAFYLQPCAARSYAHTVPRAQIRQSGWGSLSHPSHLSLPQLSAEALSIRCHRPQALGLALRGWLWGVLLLHGRFMRGGLRPCLSPLGPRPRVPLLVPSPLEHELAVLGALSPRWSVTVSQGTKSALAVPMKDCRSHTLRIGHTSNSLPCNWTHRSPQSLRHSRLFLPGDEFAMRV